MPKTPTPKQIDQFWHDVVAELKKLPPGKTCFTFSRGKKIIGVSSWKMLHLMFRREPAERTCVHCGCTDSRACVPSCAWVIKHVCTPTGVCSSDACLAKEAASITTIVKYFTEIPF